MKTVTIDQFFEFGSGYSKDRIRGIAGSKNEWTALDVLALDDVLSEDRIWAVCREEFIDADILHEFACVCAEQALALVENPDPRSVAAVEAKRKWLRGEISERELKAARAAAWDAAWDAAGGVAWNTAWASAWDAAWDAAGDAAWGAARSAAGCAAHDAQVDCLRKMLMCEGAIP